MFDIDRILAIPDESVDYLQMGISGGERAALAARGFVRKDGIKAKDYMIRTIQKTEKNKAKAEKAIIKGDKKLPVKLSKPAKSLNQKSDQAYRLHEQTKAKVEKLKDKLSDLYDEGSKLQDRLDEAKSKVESGRTKKASSTQKNIGKFAASLQSELANGGQPVPVMRQKGNKKQIAELDDKINENFNQRIALQSQVKRLQSRASKLLDASQDYADKASQSSSAIAPDTAKKLAITDKKGFQSEGSAAKKIKTAIAATSATPKSRKVVKGMSPRDRGIPPVASQFIKESSKNHTVFYNGKAVSMDYLGKKPKDEFKFAGMRIADNLSTGGVGFIKTPKGEYYQVSTANRSAKKVSEKEVLDSVRQSKPKQPSAAQKMNMTDAEYAAFKKKVKRL